MNYYGNIFFEIVLVITNQDEPDKIRVQNNYININDIQIFKQINKFDAESG